MRSAKPDTREANADPLRQAPDASVQITIEESVRGFIEDKNAPKLAKTTICPSQPLFEQQLLP